jgi:hypothetical protein
MVCIEHSDDPITTIFDQQLRIAVAVLTNVRDCARSQRRAPWRMLSSYFSAFVYI